MAFTDEKTIMHPLMTFKKRIDQLVDMIESLKQLHRLVITTKDLPLLTDVDVAGMPDFALNTDFTEHAYLKFSALKCFKTFKKIV